MRIVCGQYAYHVYIIYTSYVGNADLAHRFHRRKRGGDHITFLSIKLINFIKQFKEKLINMKTGGKIRNIDDELAICCIYIVYKSHTIHIRFAYGLHTIRISIAYDSYIISIWRYVKDMRFTYHLHIFVYVFHAIQLRFTQAGVRHCVRHIQTINRTSIE